MKTMNETLKASALMVGDYVKWEYVTYPNFVVNNGYKKVDAIYGDESVDLIDEDTLYEHVPMDEVKAVELTAEILEKNGFIRFGTGYILEGERFGLVNPSSPNNYLDNYWLRISIKAVHIEYVHKLQHALRLCGIEKEIKL